MSERVLIVDDSLTVRMDLAGAFEAAGSHVALCASGAEARAAIAAAPPDIVILDVMLPDADGIDLLREITSAPAGSACVVLMLSSETEVADRIRGLETGADEYVGKPYDSGYVVARARELLRARRAPGEHDAPILVIDDSTTFREGLREALEGAGFSVIAAASGEEGLRAAGAHRPAAVIVDGQLPGIDGATVIRRIRLDAALRSVPCVLLTGSDQVGAELAALDAGADAFVRKEEDPDVILAKLQAVLRRMQPEARSADTTSLLGPKRILAVDDSATYLHQIADVLRAEGYDVVLARSGEEALELLAVQPADCILLDLMMPGIGGQETCRRIKAAPGVREIPVVMLTAREDRDAMIHGLGAGADDFISKSSELEVLKARVRAQLRRKQLEDEHRSVREKLLRKELEATEARAARELADTRALLVEELELKNKELEAFSYSVSHDLRAPLRSIDGFSQALLEDYASQLDERAQDYLGRVRAAAQRMGELIDALLTLSRVGRAELVRTRVNLSEVARLIVTELRNRQPEREVEVEIVDELWVDADRQLISVVLDNLLGNAWKFTARAERAKISLFARETRAHTIYVVQDTGAGFDMTHAEKLFRPFQRLHVEREFAGTGIGLATVHRIIDRHGGRIWAEAEAGVGATFQFTLAPEKGSTGS